ncbi:MAG: MopE-related protein, partial [Myxococcota bacterium]|nr:MopE-related protein [Myxococcota bacterium]
EGMSLGGVLAGNVSLDGSTIDGVPGFVDAQGGDFALTRVSDALDAGHAGTADLDGTPADWGMYGGDEAWELADLDGDGFVHGRDCDDTDRTVHELGKEVWYDGIDTNCDGADDFDQDGDGERAMQFGGTDCVDTDAGIGQGATEREGDKIDTDCDGLADPDADDDGWPSSLDCDDADATTHPGAADRFYDGRDQDCDGASDYDADGDGYDSARHGGEDCDDANAFVSPATPEIYGDGIDQDCNGEDDAPDAERESASVQGYGVDDTADASAAFPTPPNRAATTTGCASAGAAPVGGLLGLVVALSAFIGRRRDGHGIGPMQP